MYSDDQPMGGMAAEEEETRDLIEGVDEEGNNVLLEVVRYFFYNGEEYVVLGDAHEGDCGCDCEHCDNHEEAEEDAINLYIMKVVESEEDGEETEEVVPVEDEDPVSYTRLNLLAQHTGGDYGPLIVDYLDTSILN